VEAPSLGRECNAGEIHSGRRCDRVGACGTLGGSDSITVAVTHRTASGVPVESGAVKISTAREMPARSVEVEEIGFARKAWSISERRCLGPVLVVRGGAEESDDP